MRQSHKTIVLKWYTRWNVPYRYFLTISPSKHSDLNQIFIPVKSNPIEFPSSYRQKCDNFRIYKESIRVIKQGLRHFNLKPSQAVTSQKFQGSLKVYMLYGLVTMQAGPGARVCAISHLILSLCKVSSLILCLWLAAQNLLYL